MFTTNKYNLEETSDLVLIIVNSFYINIELKKICSVIPVVLWKRFCISNHYLAKLPKQVIEATLYSISVSFLVKSKLFFVKGRCSYYSNITMLFLKTKYKFLLNIKAIKYKILYIIFRVSNFESNDKINHRLLIKLTSVNKR